MRFSGTVSIRAPRERVWRFLTDPEKVSACAPGLESLEIVAPGQRFRAVASVGFGAVKATFASDVDWLDLQEPSFARMRVHGTAPGSAVDATSEMRLEDGGPGQTRLEWSADVSVVGTIASIAARLMGGVAQRLTDAFFEKIRQQIEARAEFRFGPVPLEQAQGKLLGHNVADAAGRPALRKGRPLSAADVDLLRGLGRAVVYVAEPGPDDVEEDIAARRVAEAACGAGLRRVGPGAGRANLVVTSPGVLRVDVERLVTINEGEGITIATARRDEAVREGQVVATIKVIPFAVPDPAVRAVEGLAREGGSLLRVDPFPRLTVALLLSGSASAEARVVSAFAPPLRARIEALGSSLGAVSYVALDDEAGEAALAQGLQRAVADGVGLILLAGETAIVDRHDIAPRALERAGGEVVAFGAPVDPGNLLLLGYVGAVPVLGAPGCSRSPKPNVIDLVLPRLMAGERLGRRALAALGHGGLLEDVPERPMPREEVG
jgi:carbon monoxide dehydrogenase subunit G/molybdopterin biosynthesis enzyme